MTCYHLINNSDPLPCFSPTRGPDQMMIRHHLDSIIETTSSHLPNRHGEVTAQAILTFILENSLRSVMCLRPQLHLPWNRRPGTAMYITTLSISYTRRGRSKLVHLGIETSRMYTVRRWTSLTETPEVPFYLQMWTLNQHNGGIYCLKQGWPASVAARTVLITGWPLPSLGVSTSRLFTIPPVSQTFARLGDSGSWVLDRSGELVGLLFAGSLLTPQHYIFPIEAVQHDIMVRFGREV